jgi:hypothetical protein
MGDVSSLVVDNGESSAKKAKAERTKRRPSGPKDSSGLLGFAVRDSV